MNDDFQILLEALKAGSYDAKPTELRAGCVYEIVDIDPICEQIVKQARVDFAPMKQETCFVCKQSIYMVDPGEGPVYCTRHSKEFHEQYAPTAPFCDRCKNTGNDPHSHFLADDAPRCYCGSYRSCTDPKCHL